MASTIDSLVTKGGCLFFDGNPTQATKKKFDIIGNRFSTLEGFKKATIASLNNLKTEEGEPCFRPLTAKESEAIKKLQKAIDSSITLPQNFIIILTQDFIKKQVKAIEQLTIEGLNANPILCKALKLNKDNDFLKFYVYSAISRSIVTSMGYLVQDLLLYSNENVYDGKDYQEGNKTKWDIVLEKINDVKSFLEIKSGPNDLDAAQVKHYAEEIAAVEALGAKGFIGFTYGKRDVKTVSTSILETYVEKWQEKTLFGKELWNYISEDDNYHIVLIDTIQSTSEAVLRQGSLIAKIDKKIKELKQQLLNDYGSLDDFYNSLW